MKNTEVAVQEKNSEPQNICYSSQESIASDITELSRRNSLGVSMLQSLQKALIDEEAGSLLLRKDNELKEKEISRLKGMVSTLQSENRMLEDANRELIEELDREKTHNSELRDLLSEEHFAVENLERKVSIAKRKNDEAPKQFGILNNEIEELRTEAEKYKLEGEKAKIEAMETREIFERAAQSAWKLNEDLKEELSQLKETMETKIDEMSQNEKNLRRELDLIRKKIEPSSPDFVPTCHSLNASTCQPLNLSLQPVNLLELDELQELRQMELLTSELNSSSPEISQLQLKITSLASQLAESKASAAKEIMECDKTLVESHAIIRGLQRRLAWAVITGKDFAAETADEST